MVFPGCTEGAKATRTATATRTPALLLNGLKLSCLVLLVLSFAWTQWLSFELKECPPPFSTLAPETRWENIPEYPNRRRKTGPWSQEPRNSFPYHQIRTEFVPARWLIGSSNETTIVIGLRKVWFPSRQHSTEMRLSIRATRGYFFLSSCEAASPRNFPPPNEKSNLWHPWYPCSVDVYTLFYPPKIK